MAGRAAPLPGPARGAALVRQDRRQGHRGRRAGAVRPQRRDALSALADLHSGQARRQPVPLARPVLPCDAPGPAGAAALTAPLWRPRDRSPGRCVAGDSLSVGASGAGAVDARATEGCPADAGGHRRRARGSGQHGDCQAVRHLVRRARRSIPAHPCRTRRHNADHVERALLEGGVGTIDSDGIGASTYFLLAPTLQGRVVPYQGSARTPIRDRSGVLTFVNQRAAAWWALRDALDPGHGSAIALPPSRELRAELCAPGTRSRPTASRSRTRTRRRSGSADHGPGRRLRDGECPLAGG